MTSDETISALIQKFGLDDQAVSDLSSEELLSYICFHTLKYENRLSIIFIGFLQDELERLHKTALSYNLTIYKRLTPNVKVICASDSVYNRTISLAKSNGSILITTTEFNSIFKERANGYDLFESHHLFDKSIPREFRVPKPLPNFNHSNNIKSFSLNSDSAYSVNLFQMTCTCPDFIKRRQKDYRLGDIRRMCKHLMLDYRNRFGLSGLSDFNNYAISNCITIKGTFFDILIETTNQKAFINYWDIDEWWDVFLKNKNGDWNSYKYVPYENDFAYGEKPTGVVVILKKKLHSFYQWNRKRQRLSERQKKKQPQGCAPILVLVFVLCLLATKIFAIN